MADDKTKAGRANRDRINVGQPHELRGRAESLDITPDAVLRAVEAVGPMAPDVRRSLGKGPD